MTEERFNSNSTKIWDLLCICAFPDLSAFHAHSIVTFRGILPYTPVETKGEMLSDLPKVTRPEIWRNLFYPSSLLLKSWGEN